MPTNKKNINKNKTRQTVMRWNGKAKESDIKKVNSLIKEKNIKMVDLKFNDLPGLWQHFTYPFPSSPRSTIP